MLRLKFLAFIFCVSALSQTTAYADPIPVFTTKLQLQAFANKIEALGRLRANEAVTISATVTDTISVIHFEDGQRVNAGDVLIEMTNQEEHALLEEAKSEVSEAKQQYQRIKSLEKSNLSNQALLDERRQKYESAVARLHATQSRLQDRLILAPFSGQLGLRNISLGALVKPGDAITTLDDDSIMKLDIALPAAYLQFVQLGLRLEATTTELLDKTFSGEIKSINSRIDTTTRSIIVRAHLPNPDYELRPGMLMTVEIHSAPKPSLLLPEEALVQEGFKKFVYKVNTETSTVIKTEIATGVRTLGYVVVDSGLNPGDQVVTHGLMRLKNNAEIVIKAEDNKQSLGDLLTPKTTQ